MFSVRQKREISEDVQEILKKTKHPELPEGEIQFTLNVKGAQSWSWAEIKNNGVVRNPSVNPHNEKQDSDSHPDPLDAAIEATDGDIDLVEPTEA